MSADWVATEIITYHQRGAQMPGFVSIAERKFTTFTYLSKVWQCKQCQAFDHRSYKCQGEINCSRCICMKSVWTEIPNGKSQITQPTGSAQCLRRQNLNKWEIIADWSHSKTGPREERRIEKRVLAKNAKLELNGGAFKKILLRDFTKKGIRCLANSKISQSNSTQDLRWDVSNATKNYLKRSSRSSWVRLSQSSTKTIRQK